MDHHVFRHWPVTKWVPSHYRNQCWVAMNTALCTHVTIKRHLITHFLNNKVKWFVTILVRHDHVADEVTGYFWTSDIKIPLTFTETYKAVRVSGATLGTEYQSSTSRSQVSMGLCHQMVKRVSVTTIADKWDAWSDLTSWKSSYLLTMWFPKYHCTTNRSY